MDHIDPTVLTLPGSPEAGTPVLLKNVGHLATPVQKFRHGKGIVGSVVVENQTDLINDRPYHTAGHPLIVYPWLMDNTGETQSLCLEDVLVPLHRILVPQWFR